MTRLPGPGSHRHGARSAQWTLKNRKIFVEMGFGAVVSVLPQPMIPTTAMARDGTNDE